MKALFLDIDGVMNSTQSAEMIRRIESDRKSTIWVDDRCFCPIAVSNLNCVLEDVQNVWIVISSTWRCMYSLDEIKMMLGLAGFLYPWKIFSQTPKRGLQSNARGTEIKWWLEENWEECEVNSFCVIDDNSDIWPFQRHFVKTDYRHGLMWEQTRQIVKGFKDGTFDLKVPKEKYWMDYQ